MKKIKNIILDRDGTIIVEKHYLCEPEKVELLAGVGEALAKLSNAGFRLFIATNQSGIGRGYYTTDDFNAVQARMNELLSPFGATFDAAAHCPHTPDTACHCRKPLTGMWTQLNDAAGPLDPKESIMIGDKPADIGLGHGAGLALSALVLTGYGEKHLDTYELPPFAEGENLRVIRDESKTEPFVVARTLSDVADWIIARNAELATKDSE